MLLLLLLLLMRRHVCIYYGIYNTHTFSRCLKKHSSHSLCLSL